MGENQEKNQNSQMLQHRNGVHSIPSDFCPRLSKPKGS